MIKNNVSPDLRQMSDEQILKEFVKRFNCDGAILLYLEKNHENGIARWANNDGKKWVKNLMPLIKETHT